MTRRPKKSRSKSNVRRNSRKVAAKPKRERTTRDPLDDLIAAGARALDLKIEQSWLPAVRANLDVTLRLGALVSSFTLPDETEPAPVFEA